ncbi:MAG: methyl-accepting chemotaxis protein [bacterium]|jgi:methyl-accepting chemotaxis protein
MFAKFFFEHFGVPPHVKESLKTDYKNTDRLMLILNIIQWIVAAAVSSNMHGYYKLGIFGGGIAVALSTLAFIFFRGELIGRCIQAITFTIFLMVFVQQTNGLGEGHFQYFITIAVLIGYRDKVPILVNTVATVVHHLFFTYCQATGVELFGVKIAMFTWGNIAPLILHLFVAVVSVLIAIYLIHKTTKQFCESASVSNVFQKASLGELDGRVDAEIANKEFALQVNQFMKKLENIIIRVDTNSNDLASMSEELSASITGMNRTTEDITERTGEEVRTIEKAKQISEETIVMSVETQSLIQDTQNVVSNMDNTAEEGTSSMQHANESMHKIENSSAKIGGIVTVITEIANQTNLLSLNAAIEAAKAGDLGKGFAVVAQEVRNLAERSNTSVTEIQQLIEVSNLNVQEGVKTIESTGQVFQVIMEQVQTIAKTLLAVKTSFDSQISQIQDMGSQIESVLDVSQDISNSTTDLSSTSQQIADASMQLSKIADESKDDVSFFRIIKA